MFKLLKKGIAWTWLLVFRFRREGEGPPSSRCVLLAAPHTSNWDMPHMIAFSWIWGLHPRWIGKHTLFAPPWGWFMRWLGGIPIDRRAPQGTVAQLVEQFEGTDEPLALVVPPEGTRGGRTTWKSGFHHIARGLGIPIVPTYLDYGRNVGGFGTPMVASEDIFADMDVLRAFYSGVTARFPEKFTTPRLREEVEAEESEAAGESQGEG